MRSRWWLAAAGTLVAALFLAWPTISPVLREAALDLYRRSGTLNAALAGPVTALRLQAGASLLTPFLLGLLAATAPCQLSTGAATLAYVARDGHAGGPGRAAWPSWGRACWCTSRWAPWPSPPSAAPWRPPGTSSPAFGGCWAR
ncbi:hypothetical protein [Deinococcus metallilatus]|uniref:hypothetical protein n=1 Tax=Deinococcus metallilatus TaxID=1211322 RepID=UPI001FD1C8C7|nr:hypothetical protein [Deinococcus metallilatus]